MKPTVLFVSKPIAAPFHDGTKCLVRDVARGLTRVAPLVMTTPSGVRELPPGVEGRAVYTDGGAFSPGLGQNARAALSLALERRASLWHFVFAPNGRTSRVARTLRSVRRRPVVQTVASPPREFRGIERLLFGDVVVVQSRATQRGFEAAAREENVAVPELRLVPPPVADVVAPSAEAMARVRRELDVPKNAPILLYPGDLEVSRGADTVAELVPELLRTHPNAVVVFAYRHKTAKSRERDRELRAKLPHPSVRITDRVSDILALIATARAVLFPVDDLYGKVDSPIVLLEALAMGTPLVLLDHGPLRDIDAALRLPSLDARPWLEAIDAVLVDGALRSDLIARGRERIERVHRRAVVAHAYEAIYLELLARTGSKE